MRLINRCTCLTLASLCLALSASAVALASSPEYHFEGSGALTETAKISRNVQFQVGTNSPIIECTKVKLEKGQLVAGASSGTVKSVGFENCADTSAPANCEVLPIYTRELTFTLQGEPKAVTERFKPTTGEEIGILEVKNKGEASCSLKEKVELKGTFTSVAANYASAEKEHILSFNVTNGELKGAGKVVSLSGAFSESLQSGNVWSVV